MGEKEEDPCFGTKSGYFTPQRFAELPPSVRDSRLSPTGFLWGFRVERETRQGFVRLFGEGVRGEKAPDCGERGGVEKSTAQNPLTTGKKCGRVVHMESPQGD